MSKKALKIAIVVYHREGKSLLRYLRRTNKYPGAKITVCDSDPNIRVPRGIETQTGPKYLENLGRFDLVFRSPGLSYYRPEFVRARKQGARFTSLTELFFEEAGKRVPGSHFIGVTGSKGKSTTATLIYKFLKSSGRKTFFVGNIGKPALDVVSRLTRDSWIVMELSSFQLEALPYSPHIAVLCEMFPEHQDVHGSIRRYYEAKENLVRHQKKGDLLFFLDHNPRTAKMAMLAKGKRIPLGKGFDIFRQEEIMLAGDHQFKNAALAAMVAKHLAVPDEIIRKVARRFPGLPHRLERIRKICGVNFFNDSASTNPTATVAAISAFRKMPHILIAGGVDKKLDYRPLANTLARANTAAVILIGRDKLKIAKAIKSSRIPIHYAQTMLAAVKIAYRLARQIIKRNKTISTVILSPAALSFDMFKNYADRGDQFRKIVRSL